MRFSLLLGQREVHVEVHRNPRRRTRLGMNFDAAGVLRIDAPPRTRRSDIEATVRAHERWIGYRLSQVDELGGYRAPGLEEGEAHHYLGVPHPLKFDSATPTEEIVLRDGTLSVCAASPTPGVVQQLLRRWYGDQAKQVFAERIGCMAERLEWLDAVPAWRHRYMSSQWGSCSAAGRLSLNTHLVKLPMRLIDYVVLHELCHLKHLNHGTGFYALLQSAMPDWKSRRTELNRYTPMLRDSL